jgi:hypothetical protein
MLRKEDRPVTHTHTYTYIYREREKTRDSSTVQRWATGWMIGGSSPGRGRNFSLHHHVQNGSGAHPASYPMGIGVLSLGVKRPGRGDYHSPPPSADVKECVELYLHSPNTLSWHGPQLKDRDNFLIRT